MTTQIKNAQMSYTTPSGLLQVWFRKELDAINFFNQTSPQKRAMTQPLRLSKWDDSTFRVDVYP